MFREVVLRSGSSPVQAFPVASVELVETRDAATIETLPDDMEREVYCILGTPIDAVDMPTALRRIRLAAGNSAAFLISTPNLTYLVNMRRDAEFRESLLFSDLCLPDGMPVIWIARLMGLPITTRVAGSDIFRSLEDSYHAGKPLSIVLFGGAEGVAALAAQKLNAGSKGLKCVKSIDPGMGTVEELSRDELIDAINSSKADFLAVSLGAKKGQSWLLRNHDRLHIPVRAHLGATLNFHAGTVKRAPRLMREWGLEWLWRIKEEPFLWSRYWDDGRKFIWLLLTRVLPIVARERWECVRRNRRSAELTIEQAEDNQSVRVRFSGMAVARHVAKVTVHLRAVANSGKDGLLDFSQVSAIDSRFLGLLLMFRKTLLKRGAKLRFVGLSPRTAKMFRLHGADFLIQ